MSGGKLALLVWDISDDEEVLFLMDIAYNFVVEM
jgi:hypothetical protein